jgi:hypothetical protein
MRSCIHTRCNRFFCDDDFASFDSLSMQGVDVRTGQGCHDPKTWRYGLQVFGVELLLKEMFHASRIVELNGRLAGQTYNRQFPGFIKVEVANKLVRLRKW